jgi:hypothetical protein
MIKLFLILSLITVSSFSAFAQSAPTGIKTTSANSKGTWSGNTLTTDATGVKFEDEKTHTQIEVAPHSVLKVEPGKIEAVELVSGMARARVAKATSSAHPVKFLLHSQAATMGVRGTDFLAIANPVLGESEIIVFEGNVDFTSTTDAKDEKHIPAGHWGGIGGRFGAKTHDLIALPKSALDYFNKVSQVN